MSDQWNIIREKNGHQPSVDDQVVVAQTLYDEGILSEESALKEAQIADLLEELGIELEYRLRTVLDNLCSIPMVARYLPPGAKYIPISERRDEIVFGEVEATVRVDVAALLEHVRDDDLEELEEPKEKPSLTADGRGATVREVISDAADIDPAEVEEYLQTDDRDQRRDRLNEAVDAIVEADAVSKRDDYGKVVFKHKAYRYWLI